MIEIIGWENIVATVGAIVAMAWTALKGQVFFERVRSQRYWKAVKCLESGVVFTYENYVREIKAASSDGKLTVDERRRARKTAIEKAKEYGWDHGIDVLRELGRDYVPVLVERIVGRLKGSASRKNG
ncbi:hypothetical protein ACFL1X_03365 [Candidatus Hydrogenedentota bacterium]